MTRKVAENPRLFTYTGIFLPRMGQCAAKTRRAARGLEIGEITQLEACYARRQPRLVPALPGHEVRRRIMALQWLTHGQSVMIDCPATTGPMNSDFQADSPGNWKILRRESDSDFGRMTQPESLGLAV